MENVVIANEGKITEKYLSMCVCVYVCVYF